MTRHFFRFNMVDGGVTVLTTTDGEAAKKVADFRWATGGGAYFTPWMNPLVQDAYGGTVPDEISVARVNLLLVTAMSYERLDE